MYFWLCERCFKEFAPEWKFAPTSSEVRQIHLHRVRISPGAVCAHEHKMFYFEISSRYPFSVVQPGLYRNWWETSRHAHVKKYMYIMIGGSTDSSVGRASDSSQGRGFDPYLGRGVVSLSKPLNSHCLPRKPSQNEWKFFDRKLSLKKRAASSQLVNKAFVKLGYISSLQCEPLWKHDIRIFVFEIRAGGYPTIKNQAFPHAITRIYRATVAKNIPTATIPHLNCKSCIKIILNLCTLGQTYKCAVGKN